MSMFGGGGGGGSSPGIFVPPNQGGVAQGWQTLMGQQAQLGTNDLNTLTALGSPFGFTYPRTLNAALSSGTVNPFANQAVGGAQQAGNLYNQYVLPGAIQGAGQLQQMAGMMTPQLMQNVINAANNPAYAQAGQVAAQTSPQLTGAASSILNQSFDPQGALFNRLQQQQLDQSTVANAMAGLGSSPYGASTTANALGNLDINWQNALLNRMATGGQAAGALDQAAIQNMLSPANAAVVAQLQGGQGLNQILSGAGSGYAGAQNLLTPAIQNYATMQGLPYSTLQGLYGTDISAMQNLQNMGIQGTTLGQQAISDAAQYMGLGVNASNAAVQAALAQEQMTNQGLQGLGGMGASLLGGRLLGGLGGLGGVAPFAEAGNLTGAAALPGFDTLGGTVGIGAEGAAFGGGGDALASLAPASFKLSDRRLKTDIEHIGYLANGLKVYSYKLFGRPEIGLMADEVEKVRPEAVITAPDGYKRVNYTLAMVA